MLIEWRKMPFAVINTVRTAFVTPKEQARAFLLYSALHFDRNGFC